MIFNLLLLFVFYLPFQLALNPTEGVDLASSRVFILIIFFLWLFEGLRKKELLIKNNLVTALVAIFLFFNFFSLFFAQNPQWSMRKLVFLFSIFPIYFIISGVPIIQKERIKVIRNLVFGAALVSLLGIGQFLAQFIWGMPAVYNLWAKVIAPPFLGVSFTKAVLANPSWLVNISGVTLLRATGTFPDPHMFSFFLGLILPFSLFLAVQYRQKKYYFATGAIFLADVLTFSRGGYLGLAAMAIILFIIFWSKIEKKFRIAIFFFSFLVALAFLIPNPVSSRFYSIFDIKEGSNSGRIKTWEQAFQVIADNPLVGTGIGNYPLAIKPTADYREPIYAHSSYLDIAAETGTLNALVFLGLLLAVFIKYWRLAKKNQIFLGGALGILVFSVHSLVETAIYSPVVLAALLIIIAITNYESTNIRN